MPTDDRRQLVRTIDELKARNTELHRENNGLRGVASLMRKAKLRREQQARLEQQARRPS